MPGPSEWCRERLEVFTMRTDAATEIRWLTSLDEALALAKSQSKPVLLDFFSPT
jgi:hypothetical protein